MHPASESIESSSHPIPEDRGRGSGSLRQGPSSANSQVRIRLGLLREIQCGQKMEIDSPQV